MERVLNVGSSRSKFLLFHLLILKLLLLQISTFVAFKIFEAFIANDLFFYLLHRFLADNIFF